MQDGKVTQDTLVNMQRELYNQNNRKFDIYHSESHRGIIICEHMNPVFTGTRLSY